MLSVLNILLTPVHSAYTVTRIEELKAVNLKCNLFPFSFVSVEYLQKI